MATFKDKCTLCPLHKYSEKAVKPQIVPGSKILLVGESAGEREIIEGKPFVGRAGQLLRKMLKLADIDPESISITNIVLCRPPNNNINHPAAKEAVKKCPEYHLLPLIDELKPKVIITVGGVPYKYFFNRKGITKERGIPRIWNGYTVVPTLHPSYLLRGNRYLESTVIEDFKLAKSIIGNKYKKKFVCHVITTEKEWKKLREKIYEHKKVAIDTECSGLEIFGKDKLIGIGFALDRNTAYYMPFISYNMEELFGTININWSDAVIKELKEILTDETIKKAFHNAAFDIQVLELTFGIKVKGLVIDTMVIYHLLHETESKKLEDIVNKYYFDLFGYKKESNKYMKSNKDVSDMPLELIAERCGKDCIATYRLSEDLTKELNKHKKLVWYYKNFQLPLIPILVEIQKKGFRIDLDKLNKLKVKYENDLKKLDNKIFEIVGYEFNINSEDQLRDIFKYMGAKINKFTKTGQLSVDEEVLEQLAAEGNKVAKLVIERRKLFKIYSTYIIGLKKKHCNGIIHSSLNITGTETGRLSSSNPNQQNIAGNKDIKDLIIARDGYTLIQMDLKQAEVRMFAYLSKDDKLMEACLTKDIYSSMWADLFNKKAEDVSKSERKIAKSIILGILYGMGIKRLAANAGISISKAQEFWNKFFATYRGAHMWMEEVKRFVKKHGYVVNAFGRVRHLYHIFSDNPEVRAEAERQAVNTIVQSSTSDFVLYSLQRVYKGKQLIQLCSLPHRILFCIRYSEYIRH